MERGAYRYRTSDGSYPYEQLAHESSETWTLTLRGPLGVLDVSGKSVVVRLGVVGTYVEFPASFVTGGADGAVRCNVRVDADDFDAGAFVRAEVVVLDTGVPDAGTLSGYKESPGLPGRWEVVIIPAINAAEL